MTYLTWSHLAVSLSWKNNVKKDLYFIFSKNYFMFPLNCKPQYKKIKWIYIISTSSSTSEILFLSKRNLKCIQNYQQKGMKTKKYMLFKSEATYKVHRNSHPKNTWTYCYNCNYCDKRSQIGHFFERFVATVAVNV